MRSAPPKLRKFARRLLALETASGEAAELKNGSAAFHVNEKLRRPFSTLAGVTRNFRKTRSPKEKQFSSPRSSGCG